MAAIDKAARLEADRQKAEEQFVQKVQQLDPPFPFKVVHVDLEFLHIQPNQKVTLPQKQKTSTGPFERSGRSKSQLDMVVPTHTIGEV